MSAALDEKWSVRAQSESVLGISRLCVPRPWSGHWECTVVQGLSL